MPDPTPADRKDTLMTRQTAALPLDPARLADLLLAPPAGSWPPPIPSRLTAWMPTPPEHATAIV